MTASQKASSSKNTGRMITVYALKTCDTCKKAIKAMNAAGYDLTIVDVRADGVPDATLAQLLATHGADIVVNKKSTTWRALDEAERASDPLLLLKAHPTLLKRPVIIDTNAELTAGQIDKLASHVGWSRDTQAAFGL